MANLYISHSVSNPPMTTCTMLIISPETITASASASRSGQNEVSGMWMAAISAAVTGAGLGLGAPPWPSPYFWSQKSSRSCTCGMRAKL
jgi:hypothetical protein